jgi:hypothetical protein
MQLSGGLLVLLAVVNPVTVAATQPSPDTSAALFALENRWIQALEKSDTEFLSVLFGKDFVDTDEAGHRSDKTAVMAALKSGALKLRKLELSNMKAYVYGTAAIVTGTSVQDGTYEGHGLAAKIVFTDTFIREGGAWKAVASQRTESK